MCADRVIAGRKIAEIKDDTADSLRGNILIHLRVRAKMKTAARKKAGMFQSFLREAKSLLLDIKSVHMTTLTDKTAQKLCVISLSHRGIDAQIARLDMITDKMTAPGSDLIRIHSKASFLIKIEYFLFYHM